MAGLEPASDHTGKAAAASPLKRGWTTGACATAATKAALTAWLTGEFPDPVQIRLPKGQTPSFPLAHEKLTVDAACACIIKDAGDDPDVTHGATIRSVVKPGAPGSGLTFKAGAGVGTVTKAGLPVPVGEPAINPVPRQMMADVALELCRKHGVPTDFEIEIGVDGGEELALKTWNGRLGIVGGLSILGTTGIVQPFSCSAWIHSIHRGVDVARAAKLPHILAATGSTSEAAALALYKLPEHATIDMGDFAGGLLKYLRAHPVPKITIAGGFAKLTKLAQGAMDLHSSRSQVDFEFLAGTQTIAEKRLSQLALGANTAMEVLQIAQAQDVGQALASEIAQLAQANAFRIAQSRDGDSEIAVEIIVTDRAGNILAQTGFGE
ncbi:MAG: cobalt-precorrin-5B (C(1))-methyltransferase [Pseudomonadota bacterium]